MFRKLERSYFTGYQEEIWDKIRNAAGEKGGPGSPYSHNIYKVMVLGGKTKAR